MIRVSTIAAMVGILSTVAASASDYDPHQMPGTYQYCLHQLDQTLRQIDWQSPAPQVDDRVRRARENYEQCLGERPVAAAEQPVIR